MTGTAVGNALYAHGGWIESESVNIGFIVVGLCVCFLRGPHEKGWVGWHGGWSIRLKRAKGNIQEASDFKGSQEQAATSVEQEKV